YRAHMEQHNSTPVTTEISQAGNIAISIYYSITFLIGILGNGTIIWITGFKMQKNVNSIWFLNLTAAYFVCTAILPFFAAFVAMNYHWPFGTFLCKLLNTMLSFSMFTSVWLLVAISVDRCMLVLYPVWSHNYQTIRMACTVSGGIWVLAFIVASPHLGFRKTHLSSSGQIHCYNSYMESTGWNGTGIQNSNRNIHLTMFVIRLLLGFVIPFLTITISYAAIAITISLNHLFRSSKPFKVIAMAIVSFFVCWAPYHVLSCMLLFHDAAAPNTVQHFFVLLSSGLLCVNCCLTPLFYIIMAESYKGIFRKSLFTLFEGAFKDETSKINSQSKENIGLSHSQVREDVYNVP
uniref:Probable G-protein coupled receptor 33 n=1 Tax=Latimeria chalumnae TaxID=7897 RepID=H3AZ17_LATCH